MTIEEIADSLPNGFHDAYVAAVSIDYAGREAIFTLEVDASDAEARAREEYYRPAELRLRGLLYLVIDPPGPPAEEHLPPPGKLWITADSSDFGLLEHAPALPGPLPPGAFRHWFFVSNLNCFIYAAATDAGFRWLD